MIQFWSANHQGRKPGSTVGAQETIAEKRSVEGRKFLAASLKLLEEETGIRELILIYGVV